MTEHPENFEDVTIYDLDAKAEEELLLAHNECTFIWSNKEGWPVGEHNRAVKRQLNGSVRRRAAGRPSSGRGRQPSPGPSARVATLCPGGTSPATVTFSSISAVPPTSCCRAMTTSSAG